MSRDREGEKEKKLLRFFLFFFVSEPREGEKKRSLLYIFWLMAARERDEEEARVFAHAGFLYI